MYMDDIKYFAKNEKELGNLIQTVGTESQDIGMEFRIEKSAMLVMKSGQRHITEIWPNHVVIRMNGEKENYKYLGILEPDIIKQVDMKEKKIKKSISEEPENYLR